MRVNIYIRKSDEQAWSTIEDKPTFIHNAIKKLKAQPVAPAKPTNPNISK